MSLVLKLAVVLLVVACKGQAEKCWKTRNEAKSMQNALVSTDCKAGPHKTLIRFDAPEGFDKVYPSTDFAMRCTGMGCLGVTDHSCVATKNTTRILKSELIKLNDPMNRKCIEQEIEEHLSCECACATWEKDCSMLQVYNAKMCRCDCSPKLKRRCDERMVEMPHTVMWDPKACACVCNNMKLCGGGEIWVNDICRCVSRNEIDAK